MNDGILDLGGDGAEVISMKETYEDGDDLCDGGDGQGGALYGGDGWGDEYGDESADDGGGGNDGHGMIAKR